MRQPDPFLSEKTSSKKKYGGRHCSYFPIDGDRGVRKYFPPRRYLPPKKTLLQGLVVLGLPLSIEIQYAHSLTHSLTFPFLSFIFSPRSSIPPMGYIFAGGEYTLTRSSIPRVSYHLRSRCCFPPFFSSYGGFAIENKLFSSLLLLSLLSLFAPVCFPWESGDSTD